MTKLDAYFYKFHDNLAYIELKEVAKHEDLSGLSLSIYIEDMKEGIKSGDFANNINLDLIFEAMIINLAIDFDFIYKDAYIKALNNYIKDLGAYATDKIIKEANPNKALLLARGFYLLERENNFAAYLYAKLLWPKAYEEESEYKDDFVREALRILQEAIGRDEDFAIGFYELGNIYANLGEYIKARSYYKNALRKTEDELAKEEIRNKIEAVDDNAEIEESLYFIGKSDYSKAVDVLSKLLTKVKRADAYYYLGVAYQNMGLYENSIMAFENSLDLNADFRELYNDYAISLYLNKEELEAIKIIKQGLEKYPQDPRMTYNKIQINLVLGNLSKAKEDIEELLTYDDLTDEIKENLSILKNHYKL